MIYRYSSIIDSDSDVVICPTGVTEDIAQGSLHENLICLLEPGYTKRHFDIIKNNSLNLCQPFIYYCQEDDWAGRWVINFPVMEGMSYGNFMVGVERCLQIAKNCGKIDSIAVAIPMEGMVWPEAAQEWAWLFHESRVLVDSGIQVEVFTEDGPDEVVLEVVETVETVEATCPL
jgi:hypothetical protein